MELRFHTVDAGRFLRVDAAGRVDLADSLRMARQIAAFDAGGLPILLDVRGVRRGLSTLDMVQLIDTMLAEVGRYRRRLALLTRGDDQIERAQFMQNYSNNRGIPIAAFADYDQAVAWLQRG